MRILVVDDRRRIRAGSQWPQPTEVVYAKTSGEGLDFLATDPMFDQVWLDHDLGGEDTTLPVADELVKLAVADADRPWLIVLHTQNPVGRQRLERQLATHYTVAHMDPMRYMEAVGLHKVA